MASEAVLKYLEVTNRPYSCADVTVNLRGAFTKTAVQKALDGLFEAGKIKCKLYGKQKVYAAIQHDSADCTDVQDYDTHFKNITHELDEKRNILKTTEAALKTLISTPTSAVAKTRIADTRSNIELIENKLQTLRNSIAVLSVCEKNAILNEHDKYLREYRKRKRICSDMIETVLEGYPKSKKDLLEHLCIETDEMVNFKLVT